MGNQAVEWIVNEVECESDSVVQLIINLINEYDDNGGILTQELTSKYMKKINSLNNIGEDNKINELVSLVLWTSRRLQNAHKEFAYKELVSIVGKEHPYLECVKDELGG